MLCYFRHMQEIFEQTGIEDTKEIKKDMDSAIHKIVDIEYKSYPDA
ncbi:MAG: hypothetical protein ACYCZ1_03480 [Candidatus Humimicrobiaceae bacterium]